MAAFGAWLLNPVAGLSCPVLWLCGPIASTIGVWCPVNCHRVCQTLSMCDALSTATGYMSDTKHFVVVVVVGGGGGGGWWWWCSIDFPAMYCRVHSCDCVGQMQALGVWCPIHEALCCCCCCCCCCCWWWWWWWKGENKSAGPITTIMTITTTLWICGPYWCGSRVCWYPFFHNYAPS